MSLQWHKASAKNPLYHFFHVWKQFTDEIEIETNSKLYPDSLSLLLNPS